MRSQSFTLASRLLKTCRAPKRLEAISQQWQYHISNTFPHVKILPTTSAIWRRSITTQETKEEIEGQMEYASANDTPVEKEADEDTVANIPEPQTDKDSSNEPKPLPEDHVAAVEEVKQRLIAWIDPLLNSGKHSGSSRTRAVVKNLFVTIKTINGSDYALKVTFDRIDKANALNAKLMTDLTILFEAFSGLSGLSVVTLASKGQSKSAENPARIIFSAGADVKEMSEIETPAQAEAFIRTISGLCTAIRNLPALVIAHINGPCIGAGLELVASCDLRYATRDARFSMPEVKLGIPSVVQARLLCDIVGWARARELMLTGNTWTPQQALDAGLVSGVFDKPSGMGKHTHSLAQAVVNMPQAYKSQKRLMRLWENCSIDDGIEASVKAFADVWQNEQTKERAKTAMKKVLEKKPPKNSVEEERSVPIRKTII